MLLVKYFRAARHGNGCSLSRSSVSMVEFLEINLVQDLAFSFPRMDLVLIRNVMIYFDVETKKTILGKNSPRAPGRMATWSSAVPIRCSISCSIFVPPRRAARRLLSDDFLDRRPTLRVGCG